jgi:hypothetical protein
MGFSYNFLASEPDIIGSERVQRFGKKRKGFYQSSETVGAQAVHENAPGRRHNRKQSARRKSQSLAWGGAGLFELTTLSPKGQGR